MVVSSPGCSTLYSEDLQHGMRFDTLAVVNPFLEAAVVHQALTPHRKTRTR